MKTKNKSITIISIGLSIIIVGLLLTNFVPDPNYHNPRSNPYWGLFQFLLPIGIIISILGMLIGVWKKRK